MRITSTGLRNTPVAAAAQQHTSRRARASRPGERIGQHTVDITAPGNKALEIADYASSGGTMPKVVRDFINRTTDPVCA
jgi:hypothetical protein